MQNRRFSTVDRRSTGISPVFPASRANLPHEEQKVDEYEALLCKPMLEISQQNGDFNANYKAQMQLLADRMVSQKAFKELAIQFGFENGLNKDQVIQMGKDKKYDVFNNRNNPEHNSNASDGNIIEKYYKE